MSKPFGPWLNGSQNQVTRDTIQSSPNNFVTYKRLTNPNYNIRRPDNISAKPLSCLEIGLLTYYNKTLTHITLLNHSRINAEIKCYYYVGQFSSYIACMRLQLTLSVVNIMIRLAYKVIETMHVRILIVEVLIPRPRFRGSVGCHSNCQPKSLYPCSLITPRPVTTVS